MSEPNWHEKIRKTRRALGLSQTDLAQLSGLSLPSIQNIEAGKANPSWLTLKQLSAPLGLSILWQRERPDWDTLAALGVPLTQKGSTPHRPSGALLVSQLRLALVDLVEEPKSQETERKSEAITAVLLALKGHYPSFYHEHFGRCEPARELLTKINGRTIKLRRQALAILGRYL